jgi:hypothetical protein
MEIKVVHNSKSKEIKKWDVLEDEHIVGSFIDEASANAEKTKREHERQRKMAVPKKRRDDSSIEGLKK